LVYILETDLTSTWMPLENPAVDYPLILGDRTTFLEDDIIAADQILPDFLGEFAHPRYRDSQAWYWLNNQTPGEITLFSSFDSSVPGNIGGKHKALSIVMQGLKSH
jgi:hypothetical protein